MDTQTLTHPRLSRLRRTAPKFLVCLFAVALFSTVLATPAHAAEWWDIAGNVMESINGFVAGLLRGFAEACFDSYSTAISAVGQESFLTGSFSTLFGTGGSTSVWDVINTIHQSMIVPFGESILALVMLVQVVKISQRIDATATFPAVKEIVVLAVIYVILHWLIVNSVDLCAAIFDEFNRITAAIFSAGETSVAALTIPEELTDLGVLLLLDLMGVFMIVIGFAATIIVWVMSAARAIQIYILAAFSPIPLSLLGFEETRSMGVGFFKSFAAVCLAGAIMAFTVTIFPIMATSSFASINGFIITNEAGTTISIIPLVGLIGLPILLIISVVKSGAWARDLLGG